MDGLLGLSTNQYDVLELAPDASAEEIEAAFDSLVRQKGYRLDVPLHLWPRRLREINAAYATLRDPIKRSIYDQSLRGSPETPIWPNLGIDPGSESLIRPAKLRQPPKTTTKKAGIVGTGADNNVAGGPQVQPAKPRQPRKAPAKTLSAVGAGVGAKVSSSEQPKARQQAKKAAEKKPKRRNTGMGAAMIVGGDVAQPAAATEIQDHPFVEVGNRAEQGEAQPSQPAIEEREPVAVAETQAPAGMADPRRVDTAAPVHGRTSRGNAYAAPHRARRIPVKYWGTGVGLAAVALGWVLFASGPEETGRELAASRDSSSSAVGTQRTPGQASTQSLPGITDPVPDTGEGLNAEEIAAALDDAAAASASLRAWNGSATAPTSGVSTPDVAGGDARTPAATGSPMSEPEPGTEPRSGTTASAASADAAAPSNNGGVAGPNTGLVVAQQPTAKSTGSPHRWIGGGPTAADNRRGRYRGIVAVRFTVGPQGRVANCTAARTSGNAKLDALTCRILMERGRFEPARDAQGRSVASEGSATFMWTPRLGRN